MGSTFISLHYHIVFATKHRQTLIDASWRSRLHEYLGGTIKGLDGFVQGVGGTEDHVHLLVGLKSTHRLADLMRELSEAECSPNSVFLSISCFDRSLPVGSGLGRHDQTDRCHRL